MKVRTEARRDAILEIASQVFLEFGFERASMSEIVRRIGGSKSTIYGYFASKDVLFQAVTHAAGEKHVQTAFDELDADNGSGDVRTLLTRFGELLVRFICSPELVATQRMVLAEAGHSHTGQLFYEAGPRRGLDRIAQYLSRAMANGQLRQDDPQVASAHFGALLQSEHQFRWYFKDTPPATAEHIQQSAGRAVAAFLRAYAPKDTDAPASDAVLSASQASPAKSAESGARATPPPSV